jgi:hypothetical protein
MTRIATLALALGLFLAPGHAAAQQQHLERDFDVLGRGGTIHWVSLPLVPSIPDAANSNALNANKCVGDANGPLAGDGLLNADDLICLWWTARANPATGGTFTLSRIKSDECTPIGRTGAISLGAVRFGGHVFPIVPGEAYQVLVTTPPASTARPRSHAVIDGSGNAAWSGMVVSYAPTCSSGQTTSCCGASAPRLHLLNLPYESVYVHSDEILCGLEGVDWSDADGDGKPDTCWDDADLDRRWDPGEATTGIFDGRTLVSVATMPATAPPQVPTWRHVSFTLGRLRFNGTRFPLVQGEAYVALLNPGHSPTLWRPENP